jgi:uncharacterized membrane protein
VGREVVVADDETTPIATLGKGRMEAFSDGVLAIAITLLVLDVAIRPPGSPLHQFLRGWPSYLAYLVSFLTIGGSLTTVSPILWIGSIGSFSG